MNGDLENDLAILRALMARELETINNYQTLADEADDEDAREFFLHILEEEKLHVAEALEMIARLDPEQTDLLVEGFRSGHKPGEIPEAIRPSDPVALPPPLAPVPEHGIRRPALTVGSLRGAPQELHPRRAVD